MVVAKVIRWVDLRFGTGSCAAELQAVRSVPKGSRRHMMYDPNDQ